MPISAAGFFLPGSAALWLDRFKANPGWFLLGVTLLALLLFASGRLSRKIRDVMRNVWEPILAAPGQNVPAAQPPADFVYWLRTRPAYQAFFRALTRHIFPFVFAMAFYFVAIVLVSRLTFSVWSAVGGVCRQPNDSKPLNGMASAVSFDPKNPCAAMGYSVQEGARYRIWIRTSDNWNDKRIRANVEGFSRWWLYGAVPFRRWIAEPWFKPIARIGVHGNDEYPLNAAVPFAAGDPKRVLAGEIQARRSGELFLYVNDAVFLWPWLHTYGNNNGMATVHVQRVEALPIPK
jgi:hypothetical protein